MLLSSFVLCDSTGSVKIGGVEAAEDWGEEGRIAGDWRRRSAGSLIVQHGG